MKSDQERWDKKYQDDEFACRQETKCFPKKTPSFFGKRSRAGSCRRRRAETPYFLAQRGWKVDAVDISPVGLRKARRLAKQAGLKINLIQADLDTYRIPSGKYDLIAVFYFWDRRLVPRLKRALKKGGRILFETYTLETLLQGLEGPQEAKYLLKANELLDLFRDFRVLFYREGVFREGGRNKAVASLIAEKV